MLAPNDLLDYYTYSFLFIVRGRLFVSGCRVFCLPITDSKQPGIITKIINQLPRFILCLSESSLNSDKLIEIPSRVSLI
jgi:hypothetical protein